MIPPRSNPPPLMISFDAYHALVNLFDEIEYLDQEIPVYQRISTLGGAHGVIWHEWKTIEDKFKWEPILNEIIQRQK